MEEAESVSKDQIVGIGFDATCSLVLVGQVSYLANNGFADDDVDDNDNGDGEDAENDDLVVK